MPRKLMPDYEHMTIEEICCLSPYRYRQFRLWLESKQKKKEIQSDFNEYLNKSCEKYERSGNHERRTMG